MKLESRTLVWTTYTLCGLPNHLAVLISLKTRRELALQQLYLVARGDVQQEARDPDDHAAPLRGTLAAALVSQRHPGGIRTRASTLLSWGRVWRAGEFLVWRDKRLVVW